ncbi:MAG: hypothetical protein GXO77_04710 [Calditrichaeota bacterium]|nr:hypothetical protein [Calditrichota bacterium]
MKPAIRSIGKPLFPFFVLLLFFLSPGLNRQLHAQPSDARMKKDLVKNKKGLISIRFTSNGSKRLENLKYVWVRDVEIIRKANIPEYPDIKLLIWGTMVYDIIGGKFIYSRFRVGYNSYLGIPNPKESDIKSFLDRHGTKKLVGDWLYDNIVSDVSYKIADEPRWEWHTPKSVSFNVAATYDVLSQVGKAVETVKQIFRVRLYADKIKAPWVNMMSTPKEKKVISSRKVSPEEYARLKREETLGIIESKRKAEAALSALPDVDIPDFKSDVEIIMYTHKMLRESSPEELEAYLMRVIAPGFFLPGSNVMLNQRGADFINDVVRRAHKLNITYGEAYCPDPVVAHRQRGMMSFYSKAGKGKTRISVSEFGGVYKEGVLSGKQWKITDLSISIPNKPDQIAYIRSFSDPNKLCPGNKSAKTDNSPSAISWKKVSLPEINLQIVFPDNKPKKTVKGNMYQYLLKHQTGTYMLTAWKLGKKVSKAKASQIIDNMAANFAKNMKYKITSRNTFIYKGNEGKVFTIASGNNLIRYKSVVVGDILYQLVLSSTKQVLKKNLEDNFFGAFTVAR